MALYGLSVFLETPAPQRKGRKRYIAASFAITAFSAVSASLDMAVYCILPSALHIHLTSALEGGLSRQLHMVAAFVKLSGFRMCPDHWGCTTGASDFP